MTLFDIKTEKVLTKCNSMYMARELGEMRGPCTHGAALVFVVFFLVLLVLPWSHSASPFFVVLS